MTQAACHIVLHYSTARLSWKTVKSLRRSRRHLHERKDGNDNSCVDVADGDVSPIEYEILQGWTILAFHTLYVSAGIEYALRFVIPFYFHLKMIVLIVTFVVPSWKANRGGEGDQWSEFGLSPAIPFWFDYLIVPGVHRVHELMDHDPIGWTKYHLAMMPFLFLHWFILPGFLMTEEERMLVRKVRSASLLCEEDNVLDAELFDADPGEDTLNAPPKSAFPPPIPLAPSSVSSGRDSTSDDDLEIDEDGNVSMEDYESKENLYNVDVPSSQSCGRNIETAATSVVENHSKIDGERKAEPADSYPTRKSIPNDVDGNGDPEKEGSIASRKIAVEMLPLSEWNASRSTNCDTESTISTQTFNKMQSTYGNAEHMKVETSIARVNSNILAEAQNQPTQNSFIEDQPSSPVLHPKNKSHFNLNYNVTTPRHKQTSDQSSDQCNNNTPSTLKSQNPADSSSPNTLVRRSLGSLYSPVAKSRIASSKLKLSRFSLDHPLSNRMLQQGKKPHKKYKNLDNDDIEDIFWENHSSRLDESTDHTPPLKSKRRESSSKKNELTKNPDRSSSESRKKGSKRKERLSLGDHIREIVTGDANIRVRDHLFDLDLPSVPASSPRRPVTRGLVSSPLQSERAQSRQPCSNIIGSLEEQLDRHGGGSTRADVDGSRKKKSNSTRKSADEEASSSNRKKSTGRTLKRKSGDKNETSDTSQPSPESASNVTMRRRSSRLAKAKSPTSSF